MDISLFSTDYNVNYPTSITHWCKVSFNKYSENIHVSQNGPPIKSTA